MVVLFDFVDRGVLPAIDVLSGNALVGVSLLVLVLCLCVYC